MLRPTVGGRSAILVSILLAVVMWAAQAWASEGDYRFEPVTPVIKAGNAVVVAVRIIHVPSGKPVAQAIIFRTRLDMSPGGMADMTAKVTPLPGGEPGIYRFQAELLQEGDWALSLSAKVPGEPATVNGQVRVKVVK